MYSNHSCNIIALSACSKVAYLPPETVPCRRKRTLYRWFIPRRRQKIAIAGFPFMQAPIYIYI